MGADLVIHVVEGVFTQDELRVWYSNTIGSKYCPLTAITEESTEEEVAAAFNALGEMGDRASFYDRWAETDQIHVGECSFLKAALTGAYDEYLPPLVDLISDLIGPDDVVVTEEIVAAVREWDDKANPTGYRSAQKNDVLAFLEKHVGKRVATVAW